MGGITKRRTLRPAHGAGGRQREFEIAPGIVFLNHASFGPVPRAGREAVEALLRRQGRIEQNPDVDAETFALLAAAKRGFARLAGCDPRCVAFVPNASYGLNAILWGLNLRRGERILVPANEFPAIVYAVRNLAQHLDLEIVPLPCTEGFLSPETLKKALRRKAAVLAISWVQYFNGYRYDLRAITDICHARGCFVLVDGTQGIGAVPMNMRRDGFDALACGAQKWLFGQTGAGFFALATHPIRPVAPPWSGWLSCDWGYRFGNLQRWDRPAYGDARRWEVGTYPFYSLRFAAAGVELLNRQGIRPIWSHIQELIDGLVAGLEATAYCPLRFPDPANRSGIISFGGPRCPGLHRRLTARRIYTSLREGNIRVSPHFYNTAAEIDRLLKEVMLFEREP